MSDDLLHSLREHIKFCLDEHGMRDGSTLHHAVFEIVTRAEQAGVPLEEIGADRAFVERGARCAVPFLDTLLRNVAQHLADTSVDKSVMRAAFRDRVRRELAIARKLGVPESELSPRLDRSRELFSALES